MIRVMPETTSLANVKAKLSAYVETVHATHDRVTITRQGEPVAVLISPAELESIDATLEVLSDPAFNLAEFLAEGEHADAHPEESMSWERFKEAVEFKAEHGGWPDWYQE